MRSISANPMWAVMKDGLTPFTVVLFEEGMPPLDPEIEARCLTCIAFANANLERRHKLLEVLESQLSMVHGDDEKARLMTVIRDVRRAIQGSYRFRHEYAEKLGIGERYPLPH